MLLRFFESALRPIRLRATGWMLLVMLLVPPLPAVALLKYIPIAELIRSTDVVVMGTVQESKRLPLTDLRATFRVSASLPALQERTILLRGPGKTGDVPAGKSIIIFLKRNGKEFRPLYSFRAQGVYRIEGSITSGTVQAISGQMPVQRFWQLIQALHPMVREQAAPGAEADRARMNELKHGSPMEARLALEVFSAQAPPPYTAADLVEAIETQYATMMKAVPPPPQDPINHSLLNRAQGRNPAAVSEYVRLARLLLDLLELIADEAATRRIFEFYMKDREDRHAQVFDDMQFGHKVFEIVLRHPGPARAERLERMVDRRIRLWGHENNPVGEIIVIPVTGLVVERLNNTPGEDLLPMPACRIGLSQTRPNRMALNTPGVFQENLLISW